MMVLQPQKGGLFYLSWTLRVKLILALGWIAPIAAIIGAFIAATRTLGLTYAWSLWIFANSCFIVLFSYTNQNGLLVMSVFGLLINLFGFYQWRHNKTGINTYIAAYFYYFSLVIVVLGCLAFVWFIFGLTEEALEWTGAFFGIAGSLILASRSQYSQLCWLFWTFSNLSIMALCLFYTQQYGILLQQVFFMITNIIGLYKYYIDYKIQNKI